MEGVEIAPLYTNSDGENAASLIHRPREAGRAFDLRAPILARDALGARAAILEALEGGAASVLIDLASLADGPDRLADMLEDVLTDVAPIALAAGTGDRSRLSGCQRR